MGGVGKAERDTTQLARENGDLRVREAMLALLAKEAERFTMGDSSSLPEEVAEGLLRSLLFTLGLGVEVGEPLPSTLGGLETALARGRDALQEEIRHAKALLATVADTLPSVRTRAYEDTVRGIARFFRQYEPQFHAQEIPCSIDHPLCDPVDESTVGVMYIRAYLERLALENRLCLRYPAQEVRALYSALSPVYRSLLLNLYEPVLVNALGRELLGLGCDSLRLTQPQVAALEERLAPLTQEQVLDRLLTAVRRLFARFPDAIAQETLYAEKVALALMPRIGVVHTLVNVFLPFSA